MSKKPTVITDDRSAASIEDICISEEIENNEEIMFELDECLLSKTDQLNELKEQATNLENDIKRHTTPYNAQKSSLEEDMNMFRSVASKYVKKELIEFYIERMRKSSTNARNKKESTISALCQHISKGEDSGRK